MANEYFNAPGTMYGGYNQPYTAPGASFSYPGNNYQPRQYGTYMPSYTPAQNNNAPSIPQPQNSTNVNWIYVPNLEAAKNVSIMPSQTLYIMNQNENVFYLKTSNEMGVSSLKVCPFTVYEVADYEKMSRIEQAQSVAGEFVGRDEFNKFAQSVSNQFAVMQQSMQQPVMPVQQAPVMTAPVQTQEVVEPAAAPAQTTPKTKKAKE